jgi:pyruvate dehydrogenase E2 component (dihydrolipoamide acetyltransferase)
MSQSITMPTLSDTMTTGRLVRWVKRAGDPVKKGEAVAEVETDKAVMDVEAFHDGFLAGPLAPVDTDLPVGQVIGYIADRPGDAAAAAKPDANAGAAKPTAEAHKPTVVPPKPEVAAPVPAARPEAPPAKPVEAQVAPPAPAPVEPKPAAPEVSPKPPVQPSSPAATRGGDHVDSSPLARRLAEVAGVDLATIHGSGPHGRVIASDVDAAKTHVDSTPPAAALPAANAGMSDQQIRALYPDGSYTFVPHSGMRRIIAQRLVRSSIGIPHFDLTVDCDIGALMAARTEMNHAAMPDKDGKPLWKLSVTDFVVKALALALQRVPEANATWTEGGMLKHIHSDVGVAVAIKGGLMAPLLRSAETKSLSAIAQEMLDLARRAHERKLKPEDYEGGATTVSNLGMDGIRNFNAVINPPQATILAVGAGEERAVIRNGKVEAATIMTVTLSCDHRVVDGALGAELLTAFKSLIEHPEMLAL